MLIVYHLLQIMMQLEGIVLNVVGVILQKNIIGKHCKIGVLPAINRSYLCHDAISLHLVQYKNKWRMSVLCMHRQ